MHLVSHFSYQITSIFTIDMQLKSLLFISALIASVAPCGLHSIHSRDYIDPDPQYAPVPAEALGAPIGPGGYGIEAYGNGAYMVTEGMYQGAFHHVKPTTLSRQIS